MSAFVDISGHRYGRLVALRRGPDTTALKATWHCRCDCGAELLVVGQHMRNGHTQSCGCLKREVSRQRRLRHGESHSRSKEYMCWKEMRKRCYNTRWKQFADYGGRGLTVCPRWRLSFEAFLADVGRAPSPALTLDRPNNDLGYLCGHWACCDGIKNFRWATRGEQNNNRRPRRWAVRPETTNARD